ncbi:LysR family transcriptional regulator [Ensifer sp. SL37]|uniref:LysR family transcriptional regulator n=1 Tax=Ensifer sp. SL37 TaxID=2995137 RepID=UPI0022755F3A|nr:LysR family transcriptional regulator [Ensifer sp. SL37]MCY1740479.1 LysR family transcriptional regulator [Ensifer sp. SL37]
MRNINIKKWSIFVASVDSGSFTNAARRSNVSQPAVINIISEIEETIGCELFVRKGKVRSSELTPRGEEVYEYVVKAISTYEQILNTMTDATGKKKAMTILIQSPYTSIVSTEWLTGLFSSYQDRQLSVRSADWQQITNALESRDECVALIEGDTHPKSVEYFSLASIETIFVTPDPSFCDASISWSDVPQNTLVYSAVSPTTLNKIHANLTRAGFAKGSFTEVNCLDILKRLVRETCAPVIMPKVILDSCPSMRGFKCLQFSHSKVHTQFGLAVPYGHRMRRSFTAESLERVLVNEP